MNIRKVKGGVKKKRGDDKLVISLVLIAVGVLLCFVYRDKITDSVGTAITKLNSSISDVFEKSKGDHSSGDYSSEDYSSIE